MTVLHNVATQGQTDIVQDPSPTLRAAAPRQSDGSCELKNKISGLCLDVYEGGSKLGQQLDQWPCGGNQDFKPQ